MQDAKNSFSILIFLYLDAMCKRALIMDSMELVLEIWVLDIRITGFCICLKMFEQNQSPIPLVIACSFVF